MSRFSLSAIAVLLALCPVASAGAPALPDPAEFELFLDGVMRGHEDLTHIAGSVIVVVADGKVYFSKGYGYSDVEAKTPVDPEATLFRLGSVSKLFTWTAAMQLVERGQLDLEADVNTYIEGFSIPATFEAPITFNHLMAHTPGFEDRVIGLFARSESDLRPLGELLMEQMPARVRPPGVVSSYSNHGTALAGYIVECISDLRWEDYIERHVINPLGLTRTTVRQPVPDNLVDGLSKGYVFADGRFVEKPFEYVPIAPAGSMSATGADMARFMIAHLQLGEIDGTRILAPETAKLMQTQSFQHAPGLSGMAHGFMEMRRNGYRIIGHGGDTEFFHTILAMLPDQNVGFFAAYNTVTGAQPRSKVFESFMDRYFPANPALSPLTVSKDARERLLRFEGQFRANRMSHTSAAKLMALAGGLRVQVADDGALLLRIGGDALRVAEVEPLVFREIDGQRVVRFSESEDGSIERMFIDEVPVFAFDRIPFTELPLLHGMLFGASFPLALAAAVVWPIAAIRRRRKTNVPVFNQDHVPGAAKWTAWMASVLLVVFVAGCFVAVPDPMTLIYGMPRGLKMLLALPLLAASLTYVALLFILLVWVRRFGTTSARIFYTLVSVACAVLVWQIYTWNLLGFNY